MLPSHFLGVYRHLHEKEVSITTRRRENLEQHVLATGVVRLASAPAAEHGSERQQYESCWGLPPELSAVLYHKAGNEHKMDLFPRGVQGAFGV